MGRMLATTTFSYGQRGERADLPERLLLELLSYNDPRFLSRLFLLFPDFCPQNPFQFCQLHPAHLADVIPGNLAGQSHPVQAFPVTEGAAGSSYCEYPPPALIPVSRPAPPFCPLQVHCALRPTGNKIWLQM